MDMAKSLELTIDLSPSKSFPILSALRVVTADAFHRSDLIFRHASSSPLVCVLGFIPNADATPTMASNSGNGPPNSSGSLSDPAVLSDVNFNVQLLDYKNWTRTAGAIRNRANRSQCLANLNLAMTLLGPLENAEMNGSSGALTLLPTAGALIGAPTKELWVVYKLMPIAGIMSMLLSLGGNIVPTEASDYELGGKTFSYGGMVATIHKDEEENDEYENNLRKSSLSEAQIFAARVKARSKDLRGGQKYIKVWYGIILQCFWLAILLGACAFTQSGSIIVWWCKAWGWMFFWYLMVALSSLLKNFASVPFTRQWTLRISRAPKVRISDDAPYVNERYLPQYSPKERQSQPQPIPQQPDLQQQPLQQQQNDPDDSITGQPLTSSPTLNLLSDPSLPALNREYTTYTSTIPNMPDLTSTTSTLTANLSPLPSNPQVHHSPSHHNSRVLDALESGFNTRGRIALSNNTPWSASRVPFYAIVSLEGVSSSHAALRVISKAIAVGVFAAGTAIFASAQMVSITVALTVLCLVLGAGVFGRVIAMYMASEMMNTKSVLHRVVRSRGSRRSILRRFWRLRGWWLRLWGM